MTNVYKKKKLSTCCNIFNDRFDKIKIKYTRKNQKRKYFDTQ